MKVFERTMLPEVLTYNGRIYRCDFKMSALFCVDNMEPYFRTKERELKPLGYRLIVMSVLSRNLRGKRDLHGNYYQPSLWLFKTKDP